MDAHRHRAAFNLGFYTHQIRPTIEALLGPFGQSSPYTDMGRAVYPVKAAAKRLMPARTAASLVEKLEKINFAVVSIRMGVVKSQQQVEQLFEETMAEAAEVTTAVAEFAEASLEGVGTVLYEAGRLISVWSLMTEPNNLPQDTLKAILLNLTSAGLREAATSTRSLFAQFHSEESSYSHHSAVWQLHSQIIHELDKRIAIELMESDSEPVSRNQLTGLPDLTQFERDSLQYLENPRQPLSVAFIDMDDLKALNTEIGHDATDNVIRQLADTLVSELEHRAVVYHRSGDEFLMVFKNTEGSEAKLLLDRLAKNVAEQGFTTENGMRRITISGGIASYPSQANNFEELTIHANEAMRMSKSRGKRLVLIYGDGDLGLASN